jgi:hypothetical protein
MHDGGIHSQKRSFIERQKNNEGQETKQTASQEEKRMRIAMNSYFSELWLGLLPNRILKFDPDIVCRTLNKYLTRMQLSLKLNCNIFKIRLKVVFEKQKVFAHAPAKRNDESCCRVLEVDHYSL